MAEHTYRVYLKVSPPEYIDVIGDAFEHTIPTNLNMSHALIIKHDNGELAAVFPAGEWTAIVVQSPTSPNRRN